MAILNLCSAIAGDMGGESLLTLTANAGPNTTELVFGGIGLSAVTLFCGRFTGELPQEFSFMDIAPNQFVSAGEGTVSFGFVPSAETSGSTSYNRELFLSGGYTFTQETLTVTSAVPFIEGEYTLQVCGTT